MTYRELFFYISVLSFLFACSSTSASDESEFPSGCYLFCKEQYGIISSYNKFTTPQALKKTFGDPVETTKGQKYEITRYKGDSVDFFTLDSVKKRTRLGVAILVKGDPAHAPIPNIGTANDYPLSSIIKECPGNIAIDARYGYAWMPKCYFGKAGAYLNYSFLYSLFDVDGNCGGPDSNHTNQLSKCNKDIKPEVVFIYEGNEIENSASAISSYVYWQEAE